MAQPFKLPGMTGGCPEEQFEEMSSTRALADRGLNRASSSPLASPDPARTPPAAAPDSVASKLAEDVAARADKDRSKRTKEGARIAERKAAIRQQQEQHGASERKAAMRRLSSKAESEKRAKEKKDPGAARDEAKASPPASEAAEAEAGGVAETEAKERTRGRREEAATKKTRTVKASPPRDRGSDTAVRAKRVVVDAERRSDRDRRSDDGVRAQRLDGEKRSVRKMKEEVERLKKSGKSPKRGKNDGRAPLTTATAREALAKGLELQEKPAAPQFFGERESLMTPGVEKKKVDEGTSTGASRRCGCGKKLLGFALVGLVFFAGVYFDQWSTAEGEDMPPVGVVSSDDDVDAPTRGERPARAAAAAPTYAPTRRLRSRATYDDDDDGLGREGELIHDSTATSVTVEATRTLGPSRSPTTHCQGWDQWETTTDGFREACRTALGDLGALEDVTVDAARDACCLNQDCVGFAYARDARTATLLRNAGCGVTTRAGYDGYVKVSAIYDDDGFVARTAQTTSAQTTSAATSCAEADWEHTQGGYMEACGGDRGNVGAFEALSLDEAKAACCDSDSTCAGFSFDAATGNGVLKSNTNCGLVASPVYDGYALPASGTRSGYATTRPP